MATFAFQDELDKLGEWKKEFDKRTVTIRRGANTTTGLTASPAIAYIAEENVYGNVVSDIEFRDYIFDAADYKISATQVEPTIGDELDDATTGETLLVCSPVGRKDEPCFRYTTSSRKRIRIHYQVKSD